VNKVLLMYKKHKEIINYLIVGGLTTVVSLGSYYLFTATFLDPNNPVLLQVANISSWILAVLFAYFANRIFVFESKDSNILNEMKKFFMARVGTLLLDMAIMYIMVSLLNINDRVAKLVVQVVVTILNYVFSKLFVYNSRKKN